MMGAAVVNGRPLALTRAELQLPATVGGGVSMDRWRSSGDSWRSAAELRWL